MTLSIFMLVIGAAMLHALWNALVKGGKDKTLNMSAVMIGHGPCAALVLLFAPTPAPESWPLIALSVALHLGYQKFLIASYRIGDLTQVYPIARGSAPVIVALVSILFLGVVLTIMQILAVALIAAGIASLSLVRRQDGLRNKNAAMLALITGGFIASYSLVDGIGARMAGTALGFFGWVGLINAVIYLAIDLVWNRDVIRRLPGAWHILVLGGGASYAAYSMVVYAFLYAPIALVTALRETSIVWALLIGVFFLKERLDLHKLLATFVTLTGAAILRLARGG